MRQCPWIFQAPTMSAAIGTKNKMRTRVERREKGSDRLPPYLRVVFDEESHGDTPRSPFCWRYS